MGAATSNDTFGTIEGVELNCSRGEFGAATMPTESQVLEIMRSRSAQVAAVLRAGGQVYTPPSGANPFPLSLDSFQDALSILCADTVEAGTAAQVLLIMTESESGSVPEKTAYWEQQWEEGLKAIADLCDSPTTSATRVRVNYSTIPTSGVTPSTDW